jgi:membrane protein YqaA with SNARE-associated domain
MGEIPLLTDSQPGALKQLLLAMGPWGLVVVSSLEPSFLPVSPDLVLGALVLSSRERGLEHALTLAAIASVCCFAGSIAAYWLGRWAGQPALGRVLTPTRMARVQGAGERYGPWALFAAAVAPLPYKWFNLAAGALRAPLASFCLACGVGRTIRFLGLTVLLFELGEGAERYLREAWLTVTLSVCVALLAVCVWVWLRKRRAPQAEDPRECP